jgi:hypothetical protein
LLPIRRKSEFNIKAAKMIHPKSVTGCSQLEKISDEIGKELQIFSSWGAMSFYWKRQVEHLDGMEDTRIPKLALHYKSYGKKRSWRTKEMKILKP